MIRFSGAAVRRDWYLCRYFGPAWLAFRFTYAARLRLGQVRRSLPATSWARVPLASGLTDPTLAEPTAYLDYRQRCAPGFFFRSADRPDYQASFAAWDEASTPLVEAEGVLQGRLRYFAHRSVETGFPPHWHANALTGQASACRLALEPG